MNNRLYKMTSEEKNWENGNRKDYYSLKQILGNCAKDIKYAEEVAMMQEIWTLSGVYLVAPAAKEMQRRKGKKDSKGTGQICSRWAVVILGNRFGRNIRIFDVDASHPSPRITVALLADSKLNLRQESLHDYRSL